MPRAMTEDQIYNAWFNAGEWCSIEHFAATVRVVEVHHGITRNAVPGNLEYFSWFPIAKSERDYIFVWWDHLNQVWREQ